jgi:hypothetical protein
VSVDLAGAFFAEAGFGADALAEDLDADSLPGLPFPAGAVLAYLRVGVIAVIIAQDDSREFLGKMKCYV